MTAALPLAVAPEEALPAPWSAVRASRADSSPSAQPRCQMRVRTDLSASRSVFPRVGYVRSSHASAFLPVEAPPSRLGGTRRESAYVNTRRRAGEISAENPRASF